MTYKILLPVDGSECSLHAVRHVASLAGHFKGLEAHLANVQPLGDDWMTRRAFKSEELADMEKEWGESAIGPARALLGEAGITPVEHLVQGEAAQTIVRLAEDLGCDQIVMGTRGLGSLGDLIMGSVATKVLHLAKLPVTLVK